MTPQTIIADLYNDPSVSDAINKMHPAELRDDLRQEMFFVLCQMDKSKLIDLHQKGGLKFFLIRTMTNMIKSNRSGFFRKFRIQHYELSTTADAPDAPPDTHDAELFQKLAAAFQSIPDEDRAILEALIFRYNGNVSAMSRAAKIPYKRLMMTFTAYAYYLKAIIRNPIDL